MDLRRTILSVPAFIAVIALVKLLIPLFTNSDFGFHRDEYLYMAMADHLSWGYLEVPPFIAFVAKFSQSLLGNSLFAMRLLPALAGAVTLILCVLMVKEMGGGNFARVLSALAYFFSVVYLRINLFLMPVSFDLLFFVLACYLFILILKESKPWLWILLGLTVGVGLLNKYTMLLFGFGALLGLLLTSQRILLRSIWPYISTLIAVVIWLPNLIWQHQQGWPFFEHMKVLAETQLVNINPLIFLMVQVLMTLFASPIWIIGLLALLFSQQLREFRALAWMYLSLLLVMLVLQGKIYYLAPAYPMLIAAGSVKIEYLIWRINWHWLRPVILSVLILASSILIPVGFPIFSVDTLIKYFDFGSKKLGIGEALRWESGNLHELPQDYADMLGWEEMIQTIAKSYHQLPDSTQQQTAIFSANYGIAGSIDYHSDKYNIPKCISKGGSFWLWGYRDYPGDPIIIIGFSREDVSYFYESVEEVAIHTYSHAVEDTVPIFLAKNKKMPMGEIWQILKKYRY
jgi:4-amino-4-deoxy-L-arabinose transferase-like glycosyltransferase